MKTKPNASRAIPFAFILAAATAASQAHAEDFTGGIPGEWLSQFSSAHTVGLGNAYVAAANEPFGVLWNPAGIHRMFQNEVHFDTARLFEDTQIHAFSFAMPTRRIPSFGLTVLSLRSGEFERTNDLNESLGSFQEENLAFVLSASKAVTRRVSVGTNFKVVRQAVGEFDAAGFGADVGVLFDVAPMVRLGLSVANIGGPNLSLRNVEESYPVEVRSGAMWRFLDGRGSVGAQVDHREGPGFTWHSGTEYWVHPSLALRVGYDQNSPTGGMSYRINPQIRMDYGLSDHELGVTHRIGISYRFGGFFASSEAHPATFSPLGEQAVTKIELQAHAKAEIDTWKLDIVDKQSQVVRSFSGREQPPSHVMWDGKNESGLPLPDGLYRYQLVVVDLEGRVMEDSARTIEITTSGPQGSVPVLLE